jgi:hypothetical protein
MSRFFRAFTVFMIFLAGTHTPIVRGVRKWAFLARGGGEGGGVKMAILGGEKKGGSKIVKNGQILMRKGGGVKVQNIILGGYFSTKPVVKW